MAEEKKSAPKKFEEDLVSPTHELRELRRELAQSNENLVAAIDKLANAINGPAPVRA